MKPFGDFDLSEELIEHNRPHRSIETEPTPEKTPHPRFNWVAFVVMIISIGVALFVGILVPGILDEYIAIVIINLIYGFAQANNLKVHNSKK